MSVFESDHYIILHKYIVQVR